MNRSWKDASKHLITRNSALSRADERSSGEPNTMKAGTRVLIVEDNSDAREAWSTLISSWGYRVDSAEDGERALQLIESSDPQILLLDLRLPKKDGLAVLREIRANGWQLPTIVISGEGEIEDAVQSIKLGAYDYLRKPVDPHHMEVLLNNLRTHLTVSKENQLLRRRLMDAGELGQLIGQSLAMRRVMASIDQVAPSSASIVIVGESGTGKELVARTIHDLSPRSSGPYIAINCAALPETLMESELFGHERGAFTGADRRREGCFELATGGTLLLDEIGEMKPELQAKLLRVLEERKVRRLGGSGEISCRCARARRDESQPGGTTSRRKVPRGPLLQTQCLYDPTADTTRALRGYPDPDRAFPAATCSVRGQIRCGHGS